MFVLSFSFVIMFFSRRKYIQVLICLFYQYWQRGYNNQEERIEIQLHDLTLLCI